MAQLILPFQYQEDTTGYSTAFAGLPLYFEMAVVSGVVQSIAHHVTLRQAGWDDISVVLSLILLNLAGGTCVEDIDRLEQDAGLRRIMIHAQYAHLPRGERRQREREWLKAERKGEHRRAFPSPSSVFRYLERYHNPDTESLRQKALEHGRKAFIVPETEGQQALWQVVCDQIDFLFGHVAVNTTATLDMDATCVETHKSTAHYCYKGFAAYQPLNVFWHELGVIPYSEFRDGNVPAHFKLLPVFQRALEQLPAGVERVRMRSDSAGYCWELLKYCAEGKNERFGRIDFAVSADVTEALKSAIAELSEEDWHPLIRKLPDQVITTNQEYAEVVYVPNAIGHKKEGPLYRFIVTREKIAQLELPSTEQTPQLELPFATMDIPAEQGDTVRYKIQALVTTLDWTADRVIWWLRERCGKSEEVHAIMKDDLAGGRLPSSLFGANAAWWIIMLIALNLNMTMKRLVLGQEWIARRMKAVRYHVIQIGGRIVYHARRVYLKVSGAFCKYLKEWRMRINSCAQPRAG